MEHICITQIVSWDSVVSTAKHYWLDGLGLEPWLGSRFSASQSTHPPVMGVKPLGRNAGHTRPYNAKVEVRVELYIYYPLVLHGLL